MVMKGWQNLWAKGSLVGCDRGQNWVMVGAGLVSGRLKGWRRVQG